MTIHSSKIKLETKSNLEFIDLTERVAKIVKEAGVKNGLINIQSMHTTMAVFVNENEPLLLSDMKKYLEKIAPQSGKYAHDNLSIRTVNVCDEECINGHSHIKAMFLPTAVSVNVLNGDIELGTWQRIFAVELDRPRNREIGLQIMGE